MFELYAQSILAYAQSKNDNIDNIISYLETQSIYKLENKLSHIEQE